MYFIFLRTIIRNCVRADEHDAVIFSGSGVTSVVHKLIHGLDLNQPPVVFVGPFEHHSNLLPWREIAAHVCRVLFNFGSFFILTFFYFFLKFYDV